MPDLLARLDVRRLDQEGNSLLNLNRAADLTRARTIWSELQWHEGRRLPFPDKLASPLSPPCNALPGAAS